MRIELHRRKDRVVLVAPWREDIPPKCKSIPGATWSKVSKTWSFPLTMTALRSLRREFGDELAPDAEINAWATAERAKERTLKRLAGRDDTRLSLVPQIAPTLALAMGSRTYQRVGARFGAEAGSFLLADEPGLGKTATTFAAIVESGNVDDEHLVIAPKSSLSTVWERQQKLWLPIANSVAMPEGKVKRDKALKFFDELDTPKFLIVNPAMIRRKYGHYCKLCDHWKEDKAKPPVEHYLQDHKYKRAIRSEEWPEILNRQWNTVVLDESHRALAAYTPANVTQQTQGLLDLKSKNRIALTGTPLRGHETRIWGTLDWLGLKTGGYWGFVSQFFEVADTYFGKEVIGLDPAMEKDFYKMLDRYVLRRTRAEVRKDLPLGRRERVMLQMSPAHEKQYLEFELMGETELESGLVASQGTLSELTRLKQMAWGIWRDAGGGRLEPSGESSKMDWILEFLAERGIAGGKDDWFPEEGAAYKYVIASNFTEIIDFIEGQLNKKGINTFKITGAVTGKRRTEYVNTFQSRDRKTRVMLLNTMTGGESIELDAWCDEEIIVDETFVADDQVQLEGRINNRSGRVSPRTWWYLTMADTVEERIAEGNWTQHNLQHKLLDGRRGVQTALHLIRGEEVK